MMISMMLNVTEQSGGKLGRYADQLLADGSKISVLRRPDPV